ncbi:hypothetical protein MAF45_08365 [Mesosutterella sp. OilRF-GAM-744-9]|uniref:Lipoprotein n=1 Tax=Mesosutterella porci TaxID=2915351 RepID=A0ABS9MS47_9BURK|nr:hypothetical protein [Mesosutterella sp. oilRF-744-WT-GAM-9]MCG5031452.1 hypothetical protein [Mesosutterella sp. oilRF-744-WT-GAM-9]MCI6529487.1 hypothetical protein [Mesosutterella sp.]
MRLLWMIPAALAAALSLSACTTLSNPAQVSQHHIMGNIWERTEVWPWESNPMRVKEGLSDSAGSFCADRKMGMQPLESVLIQPEKDAAGKLTRGAGAKLRFRCIETYNTD